MKADADASLTSADRVEDILVAACRSIAQTGVRRLNLGDVARDANVSKALIHYYFKSREDLIGQAYVFADKRARDRLATELIGPDPSAIRLKRLLLWYFSDSSDAREDWVLWYEMSAHAVFGSDSNLRPTMESSFAQWLTWMEALVQEVIDDGALPAGTEASVLALRLTGLVDGLGSLVVRGLVSYEGAREVLSSAIDSEFSIDNIEAHPLPATGYLRSLAAMTINAVDELVPLASDEAEREAIETVTSLIERVAGGAAMAVRDPD